MLGSRDATTYTVGVYRIELDMLHGYPRLLALFGFALALGTGCADEGFGRFEGTLVGGPECLEGFLPFESEFQTAHIREGAVNLFFQDDGGLPIERDLFSFANNTSGRFEPGSYTLSEEQIGDDIRGEFVPKARCPERPEGYVVTGTLTIESFSDEPGEMIAGSLSDAAVLNVRTGEAVMTGVSGIWEFEYFTGPPYEPYP
jgi:hypothetical protein